MHLYSTNLSHTNNDILLHFTFDNSIVKYLKFSMISLKIIYKTV